MAISIVIKLYSNTTYLIWILRKDHGNVVGKSYISLNVTIWTIVLTNACNLSVLFFANYDSGRIKITEKKKELLEKDRTSIFYLCKS